MSLLLNLSNPPPAHDFLFSPSMYIALNGNTSTSETHFSWSLNLPHPGSSRFIFPNLTPSGTSSQAFRSAVQSLHASQVVLRGPKLLLVLSRIQTNYLWSTTQRLPLWLTCKGFIQRIRRPFSSLHRIDRQPWLLVKFSRPQLGNDLHPCC